MTTLMILGIVAITIVIFCMVWFITRYNGIVHLKALVDEGWSGIDVQLKRRYDLIPNLVSVVKGYSIHEKGVLEEVTRLRTASMNASNVQEKITRETELAQSLKTLFAVAENYPNLKANENFLALQKELSLIEHELQLSRRYYNGAARNYNSAVTTFPTNLFAPFFGFSKVTYFELTSFNERDVPKVHF